MTFLSVAPLPKNILLCKIFSGALLSTPPFRSLKGGFTNVGRVEARDSNVFRRASRASLLEAYFDYTNCLIGNALNNSQKTQATVPPSRFISQKYFATQNLFGSPVMRATSPCTEEGFSALDHTARFPSPALNKLATNN